MSCLGAGAPAVCIPLSWGNSVAKDAKEADEVRRTFCASGYVHKQELSRSRADILRGSGAGLCQLTNIGYDGVPPLVYPQRVDCTVVDMRLEWTAVVDVRKIYCLNRPGLSLPKVSNIHLRSNVISLLLVWRPKGQEDKARTSHSKDIEQHRLPQLLLTKLLIPGSKSIGLTKF